MITKRSYRCFDSAGGPNRPGACERQKLMTAIWMALSVPKEKMFQPHSLLQPFWAAPRGSWLRWGHPLSSPAMLLLWRGLIVISSPLAGGQQPCQPLPSSAPHEMLEVKAVASALHRYNCNAMDLLGCHDRAPWFSQCLQLRYKMKQMRFSGVFQFWKSV